MNSQYECFVEHTEVEVTAIYVVSKFSFLLYCSVFYAIVFYCFYVVIDVFCVIVLHYLLNK